MIYRPRDIFDYFVNGIEVVGWILAAPFILPIALLGWVATRAALWTELQNEKANGDSK